MINRHHVCISGFQQTEGSSGNGLRSLWHAIHKDHANAETAVWLQRWNDSFTTLADLIHRLANGKPVEVFVYAYSWGNGHGLVKFARKLHKRGYLIRHAVMCDPVYHSWKAPWRAFGRLEWDGWKPGWGPSQIVLPPNITEVTWLWQKVDRPRGHEPITTGNTTLNPGIEMDSGHMWADSHPLFRGAAMSVAAS